MSYTDSMRRRKMPQGWYPAPGDAEKVRWWNGADWSGDPRTAAPPVEPSDASRIVGGVVLWGGVLLFASCVLAVLIAL